jgi:fibronectin type 3 domain-containing protein
MKMVMQWLVLLVGFLLFVTGCGGGGGGSYYMPASNVTTTSNSLVASPGNSQIALNWPQVARATSYKVYRGTAPGVTKASGTSFSSTTNKFVDTTVVNGTTYYYIVAPVEPTGEGTASSEVSATSQLTPPPFTPTDVYASVGPNAIGITWTPPAGAASYNIYYGTAPGVTKQGTKINVPFVTNWYIINSGLANGTKYYLAMTAVDANGESPLSVEVSATPGNTGALGGPTPTATAGTNKIDLSWTAIGVPVTYNVYMATCSPVIPGSTTLVASNLTGTSTTINSLNTGTTYYFVVTTVLSNTETVKSTEVNATPL